MLLAVKKCYARWDGMSDWHPEIAHAREEFQFRWHAPPAHHSMSSEIELKEMKIKRDWNFKE